MNRKQSLKLQLSFKESVRDIEIYTFLMDEIKDTLGISAYLKMLVSKDEKFINYKNSAKNEED
ncbi:hypothetical protein [Terrisporobacter mayombei]|uniref:Uncharacterized protein n=1 Tax=Terrisporobacter mayombei TaxID=1541 RepID=A0ABY9PZJ8_9FIRM|nr:hypothetical protein [Terrisporobacter mayombei]MCC3868526.1 hypothetical protein [Terrisporobacter mayombei]WMT80683.1 hypothetical protein TEMA_10040 [Terrisporobacter mayombei]